MNFIDAIMFIFLLLLIIVLITFYIVVVDHKPQAIKIYVKLDTSQLEEFMSELTEALNKLSIDPNNSTAPIPPE